MRPVGTRQPVSSGGVSHQIYATKKRNGINGPRSLQMP
jgi:hypothetical protein